MKQILSFSRRSEPLHGPMKVIPILKETMDLLHASIPSRLKINQHIDSPFDLIIGYPSQLNRPGPPVINMSGYTDDALSHNGIWEKDVRLIHKPFNKKKLTDKGREVLEKSSIINIL